MSHSEKLPVAACTNISNPERVGIVCYDAEGMVVAGNNAFLAIYGLDPSMLTRGRLHFDLTRDIFEKARLKPNVSRNATPSNEDIFKAISSNIAKREPFVMHYESADDKNYLNFSHPAPDGGWISVHVEDNRGDVDTGQLGGSFYFDPVTGFPNRNIFLTHLEQSVRDAAARQSVAVYMVGIDQLLIANDHHRAAATDDIMAELSHRLTPMRNEGAIFTRVHGNQIAILENGLVDPLQAVETARRIRRLMRYPFVRQNEENEEIALTASVGIAIAPQDSDDAARLKKFAALALSDSVRDGGDRYSYFKREMDAAAATRRELGRGLRSALSDDSLEVHYQPIVDLADGQIVSCEALLRWKHPEYGYIAPDNFIDLAEQSGLIHKIGAWVMRRACMEALNWPDTVSVAVNVSSLQFNKGDVTAAVEEALRVSAIAPHRLILEVTESVLLHPENASLAFQKLRALGVKIALDDFGMGHSSLSYFRKFSFDQIKIDRSFISELNIDRETTAIIRAIITLADALGLPVVAEGVETERQRKIVKSLGCARMQGYIFSAAVPAGKFADFFRSPSVGDDPVEADAPGFAH